MRQRLNEALEVVKPIGWLVLLLGLGALLVATFTLWRELAVLGSNGAAYEAYRRLRSALLGSLGEASRREPSGAEALPTARDGERLRAPGRVILITEVGDDSDTGEVGANLAVLLARAGSSVVLIDTRTGKVIESFDRYACAPVAGYEVPPDLALPADAVIVVDALTGEILETMSPPAFPPQP